MTDELMKGAGDASLEAQYRQHIATPAQTKGDDLKVVAYLIDCFVEPELEFADAQVPDAAIPLVRLSEAASRIQSLTASNEALERERDEARALNARLVLEAQIHSSEARTANHTIYSIYQAVTGAKGEPGNWNGAQPVVDYIQAAQSEIAKMREALKFVDGVITRNVVDNGDQPNRMNIDGHWHVGPVVDATMRILKGLQEVARTALTPQEPT